MTSPIDLMVKVIRENVPSGNIWADSPFILYRSLGNTNRGEIGEQFFRQHLEANGIDVGNGNRASPTDLRIGPSRIEVKMASLGRTGTFQFNHIRLDKNYHYLVCVGLCPDAIVFNAWRKGEVAEGFAGKLVRMAEGQSTTHKLTKRLDEMRPIEDALQWAREIA